MFDLPRIMGQIGEMGPMIDQMGGQLTGDLDRIATALEEINGHLKQIQLLMADYVNYVGWTDRRSMHDERG